MNPKPETNIYDAVKTFGLRTNVADMLAYGAGLETAGQIHAVLTEMGNKGLLRYRNLGPKSLAIIKCWLNSCDMPYPPIMTPHEAAYKICEGKSTQWICQLIDVLATKSKGKRVSLTFDGFRNLLEMAF